VTEISAFIKKAWAGGVAQVIEHLSSKHEALSSNPSTEKRKKEGSWGEEGRERHGVPC
jgi:hypothetical protein